MSTSSLYDSSAIMSLASNIAFFTANLITKYSAMNGNAIIGNASINTNNTIISPPWLYDTTFIAICQYGSNPHGTCRNIRVREGLVPAHRSPWGLPQGVGEAVGVATPFNNGGFTIIFEYGCGRSIIDALC